MVEITSSAKTLPRTLSANLTVTSPPSIIGLINTPSLVPQSTADTTRSCATSTSLLVR